MADSFLEKYLTHLGYVAWEKLGTPGRDVIDSRWERACLERGVFDRKNLLIFGDSQVARWPVRNTFGRLPIRTRGLDGDQASLALPRFDDVASALQPSAVLILLGTNDISRGISVSGVVTDLRALALRAMEAGIRPTICSVLPVGANREAERPTAKLLEVNEKMRRECGDIGIFYLDFWGKLADDSGRLRSEVTFDGLHPNLKGYLRMTEAVLEVFYCRSGQWKRGAPQVW